ncbi:universal stress protein [Pseudemcibacter aquimaris]|uniref:universal stress protein n=1 Tax=Pseudemcibacter aquimaris TaxID=2857064 RepID=UPI0020120CAF|nr:universal stress protein [Pseudemcibacter aquimaris]MCC3859706.1 universal stress protein [Pseudemcibacter aquimaris]WDU60101.1 universal stress protein [Pseudemcibacter aquimaris]
MLKTILVPIGHAGGADERLDLAIELANKYDAHVTALHILLPMGEMVKSVPIEAYSGEAFDRFTREQEEEAAEYRAKYEKKLQSAGVRYDWYQQQSDLLTQLNLHARSADLTILSQKGDDIDDILGVMHDFIIGNGLPVIVIPTKGANADYKNVLVAWDNGKQCATAVHNALPILKEADKVTVLTISEDDKDHIPEADICVKLARHGVNAEALTEDDSMAIADRILETANKLDVDLIVSGAWGHRRLREIIFGGVTKKLLSNQKHSVYLSH